LKLLVYSIGLCCLIANNIVLLISFLWAYFFNDYIFIANINKFGEAHLELIILPVSLLLGIYAIFGILNQLKENRKLSV